MSQRTREDTIQELQDGADRLYDRAEDLDEGTAERHQLEDEIRAVEQAIGRNKAVGILEDADPDDPPSAFRPNVDYSEAIKKLANAPADTDVEPDEDPVVGYTADGEFVSEHTDVDEDEATDKDDSDK